MALGALAMVGTGCVLLCCARIEQTASRMSILLRAIREGREPVASLSRVSGPLAALASACHDLAHDLKMEKARAAHLENETRQRIANRTQALERTIGTLRQQAARDGLTGLFNRRSLDAYLPDAIERCQSAGTPLCLLMLDIDYFKPLNDTLGHASGDQMLKSLAQIIRSTVRENDLAFRSGGDEFVVVLEESDGAAGRVIAERLAGLGDSLGRTFRLMPPPTLSVGIATLAELEEASAPALLARADESLYQVKAAHHSASTSTRPLKSA
jgi:diguanylate cyclase (GGDEF)-like protein